MARTRLHQTYKTSDGSIVPGVTTILGLREKPALHGWIAKITKEGHDWANYRDDMGAVGTLAHLMILSELQGQKPDTTDYSQNQIDLAENCYLSYLEWAKGKSIEPILIEQHVISDKWRCGGTADFYGRINGVLTLMDYKTGGIYDESYWQVSAYAHLLASCGYELPAQGMVLSIPRAETEKFQEVTYSSLTKGWEIFTRLLDIYWLERDNKPLTR